MYIHKVYSIAIGTICKGIDNWLSLAIPFVFSVVESVKKNLYECLPVCASECVYELATSKVVVPVHA